MFRVNVQDVLRRAATQAVSHLCHSLIALSILPGPDGPIPPRHDGAALPRP